MFIKRKYQPYREILDLQKEFKEYNKLCRGKSRKFCYYSDWKNHILSLIQKLDTLEKKDNLKHYLINCKRVNNLIDSHYIEIMLVCITLLLDKYLGNYSIWAFIGLFLLVLMELLLSADKYHKEYCFYCDIIEILEERETHAILKKEEEPCPSTPKPPTKMRS